MGLDDSEKRSEVVNWTGHYRKKMPGNFITATENRFCMNGQCLIYDSIPTGVSEGQTLEFVYLKQDYERYSQ
jgi:hypothetical protein